MATLASDLESAAAQGFDFHPRTRMIFGENSVERLGTLAQETHAFNGSPRVLLVCDEGIVQAGHFQRATDSLRDAGVSWHAFHEFGENPTSDMVDAGVRVAAAYQPDVLIGLGGGSSMDCCKGINFVYCGGGRIHDYHGVGRATAPMLPMIAVPTTSGTGSEMQSFALISDAETHVKMACGDPAAACRIALLDPCLTLTQPTRVTALTGIDAISHAIETHVSRKRNHVSTTYSRRAFGLLARSFSTVLRRPNELAARGTMQLGAAFSGMAIETSMLGAAHATANPLTAHHDIVHGQAVGVMLPAVIRLNGREHASWYAELVREVEPTVKDAEAPERLANMVRTWMRQAGLATSLAELQIPETNIDTFVQDALKQWTGTFNPIPMNESITESLYRDIAA